MKTFRKIVFQNFSANCQVILKLNTLTAGLPLRHAETYKNVQTGYSFEEI